MADQFKLPRALSDEPNAPKPLRPSHQKMIAGPTAASFSHRGCLTPTPPEPASPIASSRTLRSILLAKAAFGRSPRARLSARLGSWSDSGICEMLESKNY